MLKTTILKKIIVTLVVTVLTTGTGVGVTSAINNGDLNKVMDVLNGIVNEVSVDDVKEAENELTSGMDTGSAQIFDDISGQTAIESTDIASYNEHIDNAMQEANDTTQEANDTTQEANDTTQEVNSTTQEVNDIVQNDNSNNDVEELSDIENSDSYSTASIDTAPSSNDSANFIFEDRSANSSTKDTSGTMDTSLARQAFDLINNYRVSNGLSALSWSDSDAAVASVRAKEIVSDFSHTSVSGTKTHGGENIALTYGGTAEEVVNCWINSPGHRNNMLRKNYVTAGLAVYKVGGAYYWSNNFSNSGKAPQEGDKGTTTEQREDGTKVTRDEDGNIAIVYGEPMLGEDGWTVNSYPLEIEIQEKVTPIYETTTTYIMHGTPGTEDCYREEKVEVNKDKKIGERKSYDILSKVWVELRLASSYYATGVETREEAEKAICDLSNLKFTYKDNGRMVKAHFTDGKIDEMKFV